MSRVFRIKKALKSIYVISRTVAKKSSFLAQKDIPVPSKSTIISYLKKFVHIPCTAPLFILIILSPWILTCITNFTGINFNGQLYGYFEDPPPKIGFSPKKYSNKEYQKNFEQRFNYDINLRERYIRLYNQIQFSFFKLMPKRIIGENNDLFEYTYIDAECGLSKTNDFSIPKNFKKLEDYANHLQSIQNKLQKIDKYFIFYTTPSKATYDYKNIPLKYRLKKRYDYKQPYFYLKELISSRSINYVDSRDFFPKSNQSVFYTTGIHWARPLEQRVSQAIVKKMKDLSGQNLPEITLKEIMASTKPYRRDTDLFKLANIFSKPNGIYYEYKAEIKKEPGFNEPKFLIQGGSFSEGFYSFDYYAYSKDSYKIFYDQIFRKKDSEQPILKWENIDFTAILNNIDFVIIELNEAVISSYSSGFVDFLDSFLDTYISKTTNPAG